MKQAVVASVTRSPIGRPLKGPGQPSVRPDDLAAQMVEAALAKVPDPWPREGDAFVSAGVECVSGYADPVAADTVAEPCRNPNSADAKGGPPRPPQAKVGGPTRGGPAHSPLR